MLLSHRRTLIVQATIALTATRFATVPKATMEAAANKSDSDSVEHLPKLVLYQYKICPFCNKVKSLLDYFRVDYETVEVSPLTKTQLSFSTHKKVPVITIDKSEVIADSSEIVKYLTQSSNKIIGNRVPFGFIPDDSEKWIEWSDKKLAVMLYPNITRSYGESFECFNYTQNIKEWSYLERQVTHAAGAFFMSLANGKIKKKYGIVNEREELKTVLQEWTNALNGKQFLHGPKVTLPDLMIFGVLRSIQGLQTFHEVMDDNNDLSVWYQRVESELSSNQRPS